MIYVPNISLNLLRCSLKSTRKSILINSITTSEKRTNLKRSFIHYTYSSINIKTIVISDKTKVKQR